MRSTGTWSIIAALAGAALIVGGCTGSPAPSETTLDPPATTASSATAITGTTAVTSPTTPVEETSGSQAPTSNLPADSPDPTVLPKNASVTLFYIAEGDGGASGPEVGCGDSAVAVTSPVVTFTDPVEGALRTLLADHSQQIGQSGLTNTLWQSQLAVDSIDRAGSTITAHLSGTLLMGGTCDIPRIEQQLLLTAARAAGAPVAITVNGKTLSEALSLK